MEGTSNFTEGAQSETGAILETVTLTCEFKNRDFSGHRKAKFGYRIPSFYLDARCAA
jgi:hypothetical protein